MHKLFTKHLALFILIPILAICLTAPVESTAQVLESGSHSYLPLLLNGQPDVIRTYLDQVNSTHITDMTRDLVELYGPRHQDFYRIFVDNYCSLGADTWPNHNLIRASKYVFHYFEDLGYLPYKEWVYDEWGEDWFGSYNVVAQITGSVYPDVFIEVAAHIRDWLQNPQSETLKADHAAFAQSQFHLIATPHLSLQAAAAAAREAGVQVLQLGDRIEGEAREVAGVQGAMALYASDHGEPVTPPCLILSGGETTVTVKGQGRGGRNAEFLLGLATTLAGTPNIYAIAADTDGIDGSEDNAGALLSPASWQRAVDAGLDARAMLANNDGYGFFAALEDLVITGPTRTNVNDFRAILVLS